jgi:hypothetical protein
MSKPQIFLGPQTGCPNWGVHGSPEGSRVDASSFQILSSSSFIDHPTIRRYIACATGSVVK